MSIGAVIIAALDGLIALATTADRWHELQQTFTTTYVQKQREAYPHKSVLVSCQPSDERLQNKSVEESIDLNVPFGRVTYKCYVFDHGEFWNRGEGSLINWCFSGPPGTWERDGNYGEHVIFHGNPDQGTLPQPIPVPPTLPPITGLKHEDGVYLVNSIRGDEKSSGLAYYKNMRFGGNDGQQPDDYTDIVHGSLLQWQGHHQGRFGNGTLFDTWINADAASQPASALVGGSTNGFKNFEIYRDRSRVLYEIDGWKVFTEFWCN